MEKCILNYERMLEVSRHNRGRTWLLTLSTLYLVWIRKIVLSRLEPLSLPDYSIPISKGEFPHVEVRVSFKETVFMAPSFRVLLYLKEACSYIPITQSMSDLEDLNHVTTWLLQVMTLKKMCFPGLCKQTNHCELRVISCLLIISMKSRQSCH